MTCPRLCGHTGGLRTPGPVLGSCYLLLVKVSAAQPSLSLSCASFHLHLLQGQRCTFPSPWGLPVVPTASPTKGLGLANSWLCILSP